MQALEKATILVVDDEPQVLVALEDLLASEFIVIKCSSGESALRVAEEVPDLAVALSDQRMPEVTGDRLLARLHRVSDASGVLVTGYADLSAVIRAVNDGRIFAYVNKPWEPLALKLTVHQAAERFRMARELARERALLVDVMDSVSDGIYIKDRDLRFQRSNRAYFDRLPVALPHPDALLGQRLSDLWPDEEAERIELEEAAVITSGQASEDIVRRIRDATEFRWLSKSLTPLRGPADRAEAIVGIVRDVTERTEMSESLRLSEERQRLVIEASRAGLFDWDQVSGRVWYSEEFAGLLGESVEGLKASFAEVAERMHPDDAGVALAVIGATGDGQAQLKTLECRLRKTNGEYCWFQLNAKSLLDDSGRATRFVGAIHDITARKRQEERIAILSRVRAVLGEVNGAIVRVRERNALLQRSCEIAVRVGEIPLALVCGYDGADRMRVVAADGDSELVATIRERLAAWTLETEQQFAGQLAAGVPMILNHSKDLNQTPLGVELVELGYQSLAWFPLMTGGKLECVLALVTKQVGYFHKLEVALLDELVSNVAFALEHESKSQRLSHLLSHDELTNLARRELFLDRLQQRLSACDSDQPYLAVLWFDVSRFRLVNETLGRAGGDVVLREVARRLVDVVGDSGRVARLDANAFGVISAAFSDESDSAEFLTRVRLGVAGEPFDVAGTEVRLSGTAGVALFPTDGTDSETLLFRAETAGKSAKANGQPYLFYTASMNQRVAEKLALETRLRRAIEKQEFVLHFQPKVGLESGEVVGLEALIRWNDPNAGLVPPGSFIPLLEETGLILEVGRWVLHEAARQYTEWQEAGCCPPPIAVNVSTLQLAQDDFVRSIQHVMDIYPAAASGIDLEITESVVMGDFDSNVKKLKEARVLGFGVALDDFGTGYSSLGYLRRLPVDVVKIDRSFIVQMDLSPEDMAIVSTIISLAHSLRLKVVAEGVETTKQAHLLRLLRCDEIQGFLISKPVPAASVVALLKEKYSLEQQSV